MDEKICREEQPPAWQNGRILILALNTMLMLGALMAILYGTTSSNPLLIAVGIIYLALPCWIIYMGIRALGAKKQCDRCIKDCMVLKLKRGIE